MRRPTRTIFSDWCVARTGIAEGSIDGTKEVNMKYRSDQGGSGSIWFRARAELPCECPPETPVCVEISWDRQARELRTYCSRCHRRGLVHGRALVPSFYPDRYPAWANRMCKHARARECIEISGPVHTVQEQRSHGIATYFVYCWKCRKVVHVRLGESMAPFSV